jgi:hypothetical protein
MAALKWVALWLVVVACMANPARAGDDSNARRKLLAGPGVLNKLLCPDGKLPKSCLGELGAQRFRDGGQGAGDGDTFGSRASGRPRPEPGMG